MPMLNTSQFPHTGVRQADVRRVLAAQTYPITCKEIGHILGIDITAERNLKSISNACGYLVKNGEAERVGPGTYQAKGKAMTVTDIGPPPTAAPTPNSITPIGLVAPPPDERPMCDQCGYVAKSEMGLRAHITRSHGRLALDADEAFERTGKALDLLFPNGIPASRVIEIADLQKHMLRVVSK